MDNHYNALIRLTENVIGDKKGQGMTATDLVRQFLYDCQARGLRVRTQRFYADNLAYLIALCGKLDKSLIDITRADIRAYIANRTTSLSPASVNCQIRTFRVFYRFLVDEGELAASPMDGIRLVREEETIKPTLTAEQLTLLLGSYKSTDFWGCRDKAIILTMLDGMLRVGELVNLGVADCDLDNGMLRVRGKSRKERFCPVTATTCRHIHKWKTKYRRQLPGSSLYCYRNGDSIDTDRIRKALHRQGEKLGFHVHPQMLRRTGATLFVQHGGSIMAARDQLGHQDIRTTQIYVQYTCKALKAEHDRFSPINGLKK